MKFSKYHALGNDYIVIDPKDLNTQLSEADIKIICDRNYGVGSDGIIYGPGESDSCDFSIRIFNPDSSEAEKSGNGLRIFSRYLWDRSLVSHNDFTVQTKGGVVTAAVLDEGRLVAVGMGKVRFTHDPTGEPAPRPLSLVIKGREFECYLASVGNPHCVIFVDRIDNNDVKALGSLIENEFPNRTNVQFVKVIDRVTIQIEIWERGAGYTLASGTSSTAAATVAYSLGYCDRRVDVLMPGGSLNIKIDQQLRATMTGAVCKICEGVISNEALG